jgi:hypothetical protein
MVDIRPDALQYSNNIGTNTLDTLGAQENHELPGIHGIMTHMQEILIEETIGETILN